MKWFGRTEETSWLRQAKASAERGISQLTILSGVRRVGKTTLVQNTFDESEILYFHVSKKAESDLCAIYQTEIAEKLHIDIIGQLTRFEQVLKYVMQYSREHTVTLFIDEFQDFKKVNESIYADIQKVWDAEKSRSKLNLIVAGSAKTMLLQLFEHHSRPLYGRQTQIIKLEHFTPSVLKEVLSYYNPHYSNDDLLALYSFTGGVARYVELLMDAGACTRNGMIEAILKPNSVFFLEAKNHVIEEFGKDADVYFQILAAIATGHTMRNRIENIVGREVGGYLKVLEETYSLIHKHQPLFSSSARALHYELWDNFYIFWFRYLFRYNYIVEIGAWKKMRQLVMDDYETYSGKRLERYFAELLMESQSYTIIDTWWNRTGTAEIDLIAIDELSGCATFFEVKRQRENISMAVLSQRKDEFISATHSLKGYEITLKGLSMEDM